MHKLLRFLRLLRSLKTSKLGIIATSQRLRQPIDKSQQQARQELPITMPSAKAIQATRYLDTLSDGVEINVNSYIARIQMKKLNHYLSFTKPSKPQSFKITLKHRYLAIFILLQNETKKDRSIMTLATSIINT